MLIYANGISIFSTTSPFNHRTSVLQMFIQITKLPHSYFLQLIVFIKVFTFIQNSASESFYRPGTQEGGGSVS